jgi:hypothetical protein
MTWMTPFEATMSVAVTLASLIFTWSPVTEIVTFAPWTVFDVVSLTNVGGHHATATT